MSRGFLNKCPGVNFSKSSVKVVFSGLLFYGGVFFIWNSPISNI